MSNWKELLLTQLYSCHHKDGWFPPLNVALRGLSEDQVTKGGEQSANSIIGIIRHLVFWNERYLQRFKEGSLSPMEISNAETFEQGAFSELDDNWDNMLQRLNSVLGQWEEAISDCDDAKLESRTHPDQDECWWTSLTHLAMHNAYHIGQIVHIRKEQGLWETWFEL